MVFSTFIFPFVGVAARGQYGASSALGLPSDGVYGGLTLGAFAFPCPLPLSYPLYSRVGGPGLGSRSQHAGFSRDDRLPPTPHRQTRRPNPGTSIKGSRDGPV
jgi:hypothetical protein